MPTRCDNAWGWPPITAPAGTGGTVDAIAVASTLHRADRYGEGAWGRPYTTHLLAVAGRVSLILPNNEAALCVAWLHDTVEDHPHGGETAAMIRRTFPPVVADTVLVLTDPYATTANTRDAAEWHRRKVEYIAQIVARGGTIGRVVKLADALDNCRSALEQLTKTQTLDWTCAPKRRRYYRHLVSELAPPAGSSEALLDLYATLCAVLLNLDSLAGELEMRAGRAP